MASHETRLLIRRQLLARPDERRAPVPVDELETLDLAAHPELHLDELPSEVTEPSIQIGPAQIEPAQIEPAQIEPAQIGPATEVTYIEAGPTDPMMQDPREGVHTLDEPLLMPTQPTAPPPRPTQAPASEPSPEPRSLMRRFVERLLRGVGLTPAPR